MLAALFIMGLGMGATMMPIMSAALATLTHESTARGSTLLNIIQQVAASAGTALFSVLLTNGFNGSDNIKVAGALASVKDQPEKVAGVLDKFGLNPGDVAGITARAVSDMADSFANVFIVATILVACCLVQAFFLPRKKLAPVDPAALVGH